jgi:hypothetical protein
MPSIRVKTSRSFYKTLEDEAPSTPAPPSRRPRSKSVIEVFSGPFLQSPDPQSPRPQSYAPNLGGARLSRVSQQISNSSREALPGPSADPQYRGSNASRDNPGIWDEDQSEAVIDHLDVIGAESRFVFRRFGESELPFNRPTSGNCIEPHECCKLYPYVCRDTRARDVELMYLQTTDVVIFPETNSRVTPF